MEGRLKEAQEYHKQLEKRLMEAEKEKQELQEEKHKAVEAIEQQVMLSPSSTPTQCLFRTDVSLP